MRKNATLVELGLRFQKKRIELGLSQEELAHRAGLHRTFIGFIERGERSITVINFLRVTTALNIDPGTILNGLKVERKDL